MRRAAHGARWQVRAAKEVSESGRRQRAGRRQVVRGDMVAVRRRAAARLERATAASGAASCCGVAPSFRLIHRDFCFGHVTLGFGESSRQVLHITTNMCEHVLRTGPIDWAKSGEWDSDSATCGRVL